MKFNKWILAAAACLMLAFTACNTPNLNTAAFNSEKLATDGAIAATHTFNIYYQQQAATGLTPEKLDELNSARDTIYGADRSLSATLKVVDNLRLAYAANPATSNQLSLSIATQSLDSQTTNIVALVKLFMGTNSPIP